MRPPSRRARRRLYRVGRKDDNEAIIERTGITMASLQDQLLQAGVIDKKKAKQLKQEKRKQARQQPKGKPAVDDTREQAQRTLAEKAERDREANRARQAEAERKAVRAQVVQLVRNNRVAREAGEIGYQFADGKKIKKLYVSARQHGQLSAGHLAIARLDDGYELVPAAVAEKIRERCDHTVVVQNTRAEDAPAADDPYADYQIPDDLIW